MGKGIRRRRPSPGTAFGFAALVIALGGAAFAAIPDSSGTIHGCYLKSNGSLRVVDAPGACKSNERTVSWSAGSQPGSGVVARATSTHPVASISPQLPSPSFEDLVRNGAPIPLSGGTWTQHADETDQFFGAIEYNPPAACQFGAGTGQLLVGIFADDLFVGLAASDRISGTSAPFRPTVDGIYVYEPGVSTNRVLTAKAADTCEDGNHFTVDSVKVSVEGIR
jgi:hypothetical protein